MAITYNGNTINNVSYNGATVHRVTYNGVEVFNDTPPAILDYLCFTANQNGSSVKLSAIGSPSSITLEKSADGVTWTNYTLSETINLSNVGDKVYFRGNNSSFSQANSNYYYFVMTGSISASGNVMSLLDKTCQSVTLSTNYVFYRLFLSCSVLSTPPSLPATTLTNYCYSEMFRSCTALVSAPELPAETLVESCYRGMFHGCTSLTTPPSHVGGDRDFTGENCCRTMFYSCTSLATAPILPVTDIILSNYCYDSMFKNCTSLTRAPRLPQISIASYCYQNMFDGCTSLTTVPNLPSPENWDGCYKQMFRGCTSLYVSDTDTTETPHIWRFPGMNDTSYFDRFGTQSGMFTNCLGTRSSDDMVGYGGSFKVYYTQNPPIS